MLVNNILSSSAGNLFDQIKTHCSDFLNESNRLPVTTALQSINGEYVRRVKIREKKKTLTKKEISFNEAFKTQYYNIRQRSIIISQSINEQLITETQDLYFVFPIDGYKFLYTKKIPDLGANSLISENIMVDLLKLTYHNNNLLEGIQTADELLIYNIPYYYGVRVRDVGSYSTLLSLIGK